MNITLVGPGGSGKTTLAQNLETLMGVKYIAAETRSFIPKTVKTHADIIKLASHNPRKGLNFQKQVAETRLQLFKDSADIDWISDRSVIDCAVYTALQNSFFDRGGITGRVFNLAKETVKLSDVVVVCTPPLSKVVDNDFRAVNPIYYTCLAGAMAELTMDIFVKSFSDYKSHKSVNGHDCYKFVDRSGKAHWLVNLVEGELLDTDPETRAKDVQATLEVLLSK